MGYCMYQENSSFNVAAADIPQMIQAIYQLASNTDKMSGGRFQEGVKVSSHYSWVDMRFVDMTSIKDIFNCWRWSVEIDPDSGDIVDINFEREKLGDDHILFQAIAPFVKEGSFIEMRGEDGDLWRWLFKNKTCKEIVPQIIWES